jgi:hypothetical protein
MTLNALCSMLFMLSAIYAKCRKQGNYAECLYAECLYAECRGANFVHSTKFAQVIKTQIITHH